MHPIFAQVAELVDALDSKSCVLGRVGSIPTLSTKPRRKLGLFLFKKGILKQHFTNFDSHKLIPNKMNEFWFYFKMGIDHVINWQNYVHILFVILLAVAYQFSAWKRLLLLVTLFTLGHLLAVLMVSYGAVRVSLGMVSFLIVAVIIFTALFNIFTAGNEKRREKLGLLFGLSIFLGLLRGFEFAPYFLETLGQKSKLLPLLEVALGVEAGQLIVAIIVLILGFLVQTIFRFNKRDWVLVISSIILGLAIPLLLNYWIF